MDFLGSRGSRTFFPATNAGVEAFLKEKGYASVEDIPASFCDTLLRACIIERIMYTYDLPETQQENNELDLPLIFESKGDTLDANQMALTIVNRRAAIINELKNDSVENGVVHPVDRVLVPSTSLGSTLLDEHHEDFQIYYEALRRTGLIDSLYRYRDEEYEQKKGSMPLLPKACASEMKTTWPNFRTTGTAASPFSSCRTKTCTGNTPTASTKA